MKMKLMFVLGLVSSLSAWSALADMSSVAKVETLQGPFECGYVRELAAAKDEVTKEQQAAAAEAEKKLVTPSESSTQSNTFGRSGG